MHGADMHQGDTPRYSIGRWRALFDQVFETHEQFPKKGLVFSRLKLPFYELIQPFLTSRVYTLHFRSPFTRGGNHFHRNIAEVDAIR